MNTLVEIFIWLYLIVGIIVVSACFIALILNLISYVYQSFVGFNVFRKFLAKYHKEMRKEGKY